ncbi:MAG: NapC/NirT family cytochrome c [Chromatocurvus sp.]
MQWIKHILAAAVILPILVIGAWAVTDVIVHETGDAGFCGTCHAMRPMVAAYREDIHGGAGDQGLRAACTDCHTPHDNPINHLWSKARFGAHSLWAQLTYDIDKIDWEAKRDERERLVFDSGCLQCHSDLERASDQNPRTFVAHRPYFLGSTRKQCVTCHAHVGHKNLSAHLNRFFQEP